MNKKITWVVTFLLFVALIVSAFTVMANILPHERYGQAFIEGSDADDGLTVTSWIDGTQYADNLTFYGDGSFQIQTPGDSTDDASIKEGGVDGDTIVYRIEDADGTYIADENSVFDSGAIESGDLNFQTAEQPSTDVKINEIVTQPEFGDSQYVYLYDTDGITLGDWRLENHDGFSATLDTLDTGTHPDHAELLYVDLGATDVIDTTGDSMMLSWNPGTSGINNNEWAVMDRVEFGDITSPENTTHPEYPDAPGVGQGLVRDTWGSDTDDSSVDFTLAEETGRPVNLTIDSTEGGSVTTPGEGTFDYVTGDVVDLVAEADADYSFVEWTGDNGTIDDVNAASTTITMEGNYSITANFEMDVAPGPVYNLHVEKDEAAGDLILSWDEEPNADQYNVYHSTDAYADFGTWTELDTVTGLEYTHSGALGGDNYYIVRAENTAGEGANSSMAFCYEAFFDSTEGGLHYTSVPNNFDYNGDGELTSFDVIESITGG
ncbi:MAG: InlB B-repeat-containing protein, partial [Thermoplasmatota archaeon]